MTCSSWWFSPVTPVEETGVTGENHQLLQVINKTDCHDRNDILLKVVLNTITLTLTLLAHGRRSYNQDLLYF